MRPPKTKRNRQALPFSGCLKNGRHTRPSVIASLAATHQARVCTRPAGPVMRPRQGRVWFLNSRYPRRTWQWRWRVTDRAGRAPQFQVHFQACRKVTWDSAMRRSSRTTIDSNHFSSSWNSTAPRTHPTYCRFLYCLLAGFPRISFLCFSVHTSGQPPIPTCWSPDYSPTCRQSFI